MPSLQCTLTANKRWPAVLCPTVRTLPKLSTLLGYIAGASSTEQPRRPRTLGSADRPLQQQSRARDCGAALSRLRLRGGLDRHPMGPADDALPPRRHPYLDGHRNGGGGPCLGQHRDEAFAAWLGNRLPRGQQRYFSDLRRGGASARRPVRRLLRCASAHAGAYLDRRRAERHGTSAELPVVDVLKVLSRYAPPRLQHRPNRFRPFTWKLPC